MKCVSADKNGKKFKKCFREMLWRIDWTVPKKISRRKSSRQFQLKKVSETKYSWSANEWEKTLKDREVLVNET